MALFCIDYATAAETAGKENTMNETVNQVTHTADEQQETRMFTQAELNTIVSDRVARERAKYADYDELKAKAAQFDQIGQAHQNDLKAANNRADSLQQQLDEIHRAAELHRIREKVSADTGVPANLLTFDTEEECSKQAAEIRRFSEPRYPTVKDGGDPVHRPDDGSEFASAFSRENKHTPKGKYEF